MDHHEQSHPSRETQTPEGKPHFVTAKRLESVNDPNAPAFEIENQPDATLPQLSADQFKLMGELKPEEWTAENLDALGLPVGEGIVAVSVDGEKRFINIGLEDYGTIVNAGNIRTVGTETYEDQEPGAEKLTRIVEIELLSSADLAERTANDLNGDPQNSPQYFHDARNNALSVLNEAVRRALNGESVAVTEELTNTITVLRQATDELALALSGDTVNERADDVRKSSYTVDDAAREYFAHADSQMESERAGLLGRARTLQVEVSSLLHENVTHYVDKISADERRFNDLLSGIATKFAYIEELNEQNTKSLYTDIQELIDITEASRRSQKKLRDDLQDITDHAQQLRNIAGYLAHL